MPVRSYVKLPRSLAVVIDSDVLGKIAVSVPAEEVQLASPDHLAVSVRLADIQAEREEREANYLRQQDTQLVPNAPLRAEFEAQAHSGQITAADLAAYLGWSRAKNGQAVPDRDKVLDVLGISRERHKIPYPMAVDIARGLNVDPAEVGL